ncbi:MAG: TonB-dependent receptor [Bacteroidota bacterium]|nr:TonB-dependent receptor [Bacteroidota bacterium]
MKRICFLILFILSFSLLHAQSTTVNFKILTPGNEAIAFATITVLSVPDTTIQQQKFTDSSGSASFILIQNRPYLVRITSINYDLVEKSITVKGDNPSFVFTAEQQSQSLGNVTVIAQKPLMRQEDDKTIVDPENLAASSTNAYEIMEKIPGLFVDQDGNIYLNSTTPATVHVNGREQKMSSADIATILKSLPPNSIASIEILRTPSARYDASGGGGIVNVVLRKGVRIGLTGSVNAGFNQGRFGNRFAGINLNNNTGAWSTYINVQISTRNNYENLSTQRIFAPDSLLSQNAYTKYPTTSFYTGYGVSYQINPKWDINYDGRLSFNNPRNTSTNISDIVKISTGQLISGNEALVGNTSKLYNINQGLSLKHKLDSIGSEWSTDLSYTYSPNNSEQLFNTAFLTPGRPSTRGEGDIKNRLHFYSAQTNFLKKLPNKITLETGLKTTNTFFRNTTDYFSFLNQNKVQDSFRTRSNEYNENIHAAYVQASKTFGSGIVLKMGTRLENTNMDGHQMLPADTSFTLKRTDLFPYVYLSRSLMKIAGYDLRAYLVYRRTINRPAYEYLNPFPRYVDPYLFETGNPSLRPQFTQNYEANISVDERPIFALGVNDTKDIFNQVIYQSDTSRSLAYRTYDNLGTNKEMYFRVIGAIPPGKRYFFVVGTQYNHNFYQGLYENKPIDFKRGTWTVFTYQTFKVTPTTQLSLNGFARFKGQLQFYELSSFGALNMSLTQHFMNRKLTATISANDLLFTNKNNFTLNQGSVNASGYREGDTRRFGLNVRYNFGIKKREERQNIFNIEAPEGAQQNNNRS